MHYGTTPNHTRERNDRHDVHGLLLWALLHGLDFCVRRLALDMLECRGGPRSKH